MHAGRGVSVGAEVIPASYPKNSIGGPTSLPTKLRRKKERREKKEEQESSPPPFPSPELNSASATDRAKMMAERWKCDN